jgi:hypothetical protein
MESRRVIPVASRGAWPGVEALNCGVASTEPLTLSDIGGQRHEHHRYPWIEPPYSF